MVDIEKVRNFFKDDIYAMKTTGITIEEAAPGHALCRMEIGPEHMNAGKSVQGGAIFTIGDFAFAVAANAEGKLTVSVNNNISFITAPKGKVLLATARKLSTSKRLCFYEVLITDELGTQVANMSVTGYRKDVEINFE